MDRKFKIEKNVHLFQQISKLHSHDELEIVFCLTDGGELSMEEHEEALYRGSTVILPKGLLHRFSSNVSQFERFVLHVPEETLKTVSTEQTDLFGLFDKMKVINGFSPAEQAEIVQLLDQMMAGGTEFGDDLKREIAFSEFLLRISRFLKENHATGSKTQASGEYRRIQPILQYIQDNYLEDIRLEQVSQDFYISKYYLAHQFKTVTGFSIGAYLRNYRVRLGSELLREGTNVQDAAKRVGFRNNSSFIRAFEQILGVSPGRYLKIVSMGHDPAVEKYLTDQSED